MLRFMSMIASKFLFGVGVIIY